jgi:uncharacterized protein
VSGGHGAFVFPRLRPTRLGRGALRCATASVAWLRAAGCLALLGVMTGCQTYTAQTAQRDADVRRGSLDAAVLRANADALRNDGGKDAVLFRLEQGAILRQAALARIPVPPLAPSDRTSSGAEQTGEGSAAVTSPARPEEVNLRASIAAFDRAESRMNAYDQEPEVRLGSSSLALLTHLANLPYEGRAYDRILMHGYKALNYLQLGERDAARVELNRALQRQRDALAANAGRLAEAEAAANELRSGRVTDREGNRAVYDVSRTTRDADLQRRLGAVDSVVRARIRPYGDYVNPFVVFLDGLFFLTQAEDRSDLERARLSFERVASFAPENPYAAADAAMAEQAANGKLPEGLTYIIYEAGVAPFREELRLQLPLYLVTDKVSYVGAAFPYLRFSQGRPPVLNVTAEGVTHPSALVCSMDSVIASDFRREWPSVVTKTLVGTALKATLDAAMQRKAKEKLGERGQAFFEILTAVIQDSTNIADTRTWRSLPQEFHTVRLATPADRQLVLSVGGATQTVELPPGRINLVTVKLMDPGSPLLVNQWVLVPAP